MMCPDETLDRHYMIKMALCHDVGECIVGDISPAMKVPAAEKQRREIEAIAELRSLVPHRDGEEEQKANATPSFGDELQALFLAYEKQETPEAKFVKDMDLLEMIVQAHAYEAANPGKDLGSFFNSGAKIQHPWAKAIFQQLLDTRPFLTNQMKL
ncbi:hydrolase of HD superfamily [Angomonas deanei]|nr:hydrolase of HD superfamily [Angomonas deanei]|eukprot:EPY34989.1 hydrolase of HD superfamily [Angomonas deanei]